MKLRPAILDRLRSGTFDVLVVGGGINGAVTAACLAARGAKVALVDRGDFAGETSENSSNLAWGGIKYLESFEFGLVRKLCVSRNHLIDSYPSTVKEIRFFVTHEKGFRHGRLKLYLGALLYWLIGSFFTKPPRLLSVANLHAEEPVVREDRTDGGFEYSDAYFHDNDARFVWTFIRTALDHGAACANYVESTAARRESGLWHVDLQDTLGGEKLSLRAKVLVNAAGPWVDEHNARTGEQTAHQHVFSKGIHLIVPRITKSQRVLTFFADDGRLFFVIPMGHRTCVGTTDTRVNDPRAVVTDEDRDFVLSNINKRLNLDKPLTTADVLSERCGVRPLATLREAPKARSGKPRDWMQLSRKHAVDVDEPNRHVSIFGGKLTDCLNVGDEVARIAASLGVDLPHPSVRWYGEPPDEVRNRFFHMAALMNLDAGTEKRALEPLSARLWRRYGISAFEMLEAIRADATQAELVIDGTEYARCEIEHTARHEMIGKLEDFLRRRSKIAMVMRDADIHRAPGLLEAARMFFGAAAEAKIAEYFGEAPVVAGAPKPSRETESRAAVVVH